MARHTMVTFQLHRRGVVLLAVGALLASLLFYVAGCLAGERRGTRAAEAAAAEAIASMPSAAGGGASAESGEVTDRLTVRAGAFLEEENAEQLAARLTGRGYTPKIVPVRDREGNQVFTVTVGQYDTRWEARGAAAELARLEELATAVVPVRE